MENAKLFIRTSTKSKDLQEQHSIIREVASVDDLLDHTWHYDCVVSPTHASRFRLNPVLLASSSSPPASSAQPLTSEYVSLASFIPNEAIDCSSSGTMTLPMEILASKSSSKNSRSSTNGKQSKLSRSPQATVGSKRGRGAQNGSIPSRKSFQAGFLSGERDCPFPSGWAFLTGFMPNLDAHYQI